MADKLQAVELTDEELKNANGGLMMLATPQTGSKTETKGGKKVGRTGSAALMTESVQRKSTPGLAYSGEPRTSSRLGAVVTGSGPKILEDPGETTYC